jgi:hypothetical protein
MEVSHHRIAYFKVIGFTFHNGSNYTFKGFIYFKGAI